MLLSLGTARSGMGIANISIANPSLVMKALIRELNKKLYFLKE